MSAEVVGWREFSTQGVPLARKLESWSEATNQIFPPTQIRREGNEGFYGRVAWKRFGALTLADIVSTDLEVVRSRREIRAREEECFELNIQIEGHGSLRQSGRDAQTHPRSMVLCDSRKPYEMSFRGPYRQLSLRMPRELLRERLPAADALVAQRVAADGAPGRFLYDLAQGLCDPMEHIPGAVAARLQDHLLDLLATAYLEAAAPLSKASGRREKLATIQSYILEHLEDPALDPAGVARAHHVSMRQLHEIFALQSETFGAWMQAQRLKRALRTLRDPLLRGLPIKTLAFRCGFADYSHFSRRFRAAFGVSPRDLRKQPEV